MAGDSRKVVLAALTGNGLIAVTKFGAALFTGSAAMFSEAIHSVADTGNQGLMLYGLGAADRPPDEDHPFGYGKELYFWGFVVAIILFSLGAGVSIYEGVAHLLHPGHAQGSPYINYAVLGAAFIFESGACYFAIGEFDKQRGDRGFIEGIREGKDPSLFIVLVEDLGALAGIVIAFVGVLLTHVTGSPVYDGIASVCIGLLLGIGAIWMAIETKGLLVGEAARDPIVDEIEGLLGDYAEVETVNEVLTLHMGPETVLVNASLDFGADHSARQVESTTAELSSTIRERFDIVERVFLEVEGRREHASARPDGD